MQGKQLTAVENTFPSNISFLICLVLFLGQRSLSNPEEAGDQNGRSSPVLQSFSMETNTRTHTQNSTHREANGRQGQAVAILPPAPIWDRGGFQRRRGVCSPSGLALFLPFRRNLSCSAWGTRRSSCQHRDATCHVSRRTAVGPLAPAGHMAGQKNWEGAWEN